MTTTTFPWNADLARRFVLDMVDDLDATSVNDCSEDALRLRAVTAADLEHPATLRAFIRGAAGGEAADPAKSEHLMRFAAICEGDADAYERLQARHRALAAARPSSYEQRRLTVEAEAESAAFEARDADGSITRKMEAPAAPPTPGTFLIARLGLPIVTFNHAFLVTTPSGARLFIPPGSTAEELPPGAAPPTVHGDASRFSTITGEVGFNAYGGAGPNPWKTYNGGDMPRWPSLAETPAGLITRERWAAAGRAEVAAAPRVLANDEPHVWNVHDEAGPTRPAGTRHEIRQEGDAVVIREVWYFSDTGEEYEAREVRMGLNNLVHLAVNTTPLERSFFADARTAAPEVDWAGVSTVEVERLRVALQEIADFGQRCETCEENEVATAERGIVTHQTKLWGADVYLCAEHAPARAASHAKAESKGSGKQPPVVPYTETNQAVLVAQRALAEVPAAPLTVVNGS